ncbi:hypothetical protein C9374_007197 [Naegleria lovaniensis]|uniref:Protein kinase domain-containing protein n=1 Tax=Naegleria lovaniensis TaxID=51637 RepID=A0AA88KRY2_NAELO|nr:uncharacterized protein C9374_007197 [Naegleria lovaniensis]KAG2393666.1 hypothetical protein C9374_007197 [Naegleria lovaniensis]
MFLRSTSDHLTPTYKLKRLELDKNHHDHSNHTINNVILILNGTFNPIHNNHLLILEDARNYVMNELKMNVLGGFITLRADCSVKKKLDEYQALQDHQINFKQGQEQFWRAMKSFYGEDCQAYIKVFNVIGIDNLEKCGKQICENLICVVNRERIDFNLDLWRNEFEYRRKVLIVNASIIKPISSTLIRSKFKNGEVVSTEELPQSVLNYHLEHGIDYKHSTVPEADENQDIDVFEKILSHCLTTNLPFIPFQELQSETDLILGKGVKGEVVTMIYHSKKVAVKRVNLSKKHDHKFGFKHALNQFLMELELLACLKGHENVAECYGITLDGEYGCYVLELCDFQLQEYLSQHFPLSPEQCRSIVLDVAQGMQFIHSHNVLHRDLSLQNIMLCKVQIADNDTSSPQTPKFKAKVIDFSVSKKVDWKVQPPRGSMRRYAPEAIQSNTEYHYASDVYMFGNVVYELTQGHQVFKKHGKVADVCQLILRGERPEISKKVKDDALIQLMLQCWTHDPTKRPSFSDIIQSLLLEYENDQC